MPKLPLLQSSIVQLTNLAPRTTAASLNATASASPHIPLIVTYDILSVTGVVMLLALLIFAYWSEDIHRKSTWYGAVASWAGITLGNLILLGQQTGLEPMPSVCLAQATLIYSLPTLGVAYVTTFMLEAYLGISRIANSTPVTVRRSKLETISFHVIPFAVFFGVITEVAITGSLDPGWQASRNKSDMYCHIFNSWPSKITGGISICGVVMVYVLIARIFTIHRRHLREAQRINESANSNSDASLDAVIRMIMFSSLSFLVVGISVTSYLPLKINIDNGVIAVVQATLPFLATVIFGTQRDMLQVLLKLFKQKTRLSESNKISR